MSPRPTELTGGYIFSYLTHLRDSVVKDSPCVISPLANQFDLPGPGRQPEVRGVQLYHLTGDLDEDGFALPPPTGRKELRVR